MISVGRAFSLVCLCLILSFFHSQHVWAQEVWNIDETSIPATGTLDINALEAMSVGDTFDLRVDQISIYPILIDQLSVSENGDRSWFGSITSTGLDYALVITVGKETAHLILTSPSGIFQLYGLNNGESKYSGVFNRLEHVRDEAPTTDTIIPITDNNESTTPEDPDLSDGNEVVISQSVSQEIAPVGANLTFDFDFHLPGGEKLFDQYVDIFFVLENTDLLVLPENCEELESTEMQPVLSCNLGDFNSGEHKQLSFTVVTSENSHPLVYSTALVGEMRSDAIVELYRDVATDTDEDGVSDYNEELLGTDALDGMLADNRDAVIDVLVAYTPEVNDIYRGEVDTRINQLFNVANKIFADSQVGISLRPVGVHEVAYTPAESLFSDLTTVTFQSAAALQDLGRMRSLFGGDLVVLFRSGEENGLCGLANLGGSGTQGDFTAEYHKDFAISVINIDCMDDSVLAHEVGHNLGLVHSRREDSAGGTFPYSAGFGVDTRYVSVMAFPDDFDVGNRLYRFSDPSRTCGPFQCGEDKDNSVDGADAVTSLNLVKYQVENYFSSQEERINTIKTVSSLDGSSDAELGLGIFSASSTTFGNTFPKDELLNFKLKITPLASQVGQEFTTHVVVVKGKNEFYQATAEGLFIPWDGTLKTLKGITSPQDMSEQELLDILTDMDFQAAGLADTSVKLFIAYRMLKTGELVYSAVPSTLMFVK